jgi:hypothetical protein
VAKRNKEEQALLDLIYQQADMVPAQDGEQMLLFEKMKALAKEKKIPLSEMGPYVEQASGKVVSAEVAGGLYYFIASSCAGVRGATCCRSCSQNLWLYLAQQS